jgi:hypothetical protein
MYRVREGERKMVHASTDIYINVCVSILKITLVKHTCFPGYILILFKNTMQFLLAVQSDSLSHKTDAWMEPSKDDSILSPARAAPTVRRFSRFFSQSQEVHVVSTWELLSPHGGVFLC